MGRIEPTPTRIMVNDFLLIFLITEYLNRMLPYWFPVHPARFWCHCRMVYLPMCYVYGRKGTMPQNELLSSLREVKMSTFNIVPTSN